MIRNQNIGQRGTRRLSYANVVASLALMVALGGTATAAITLPNNSVGSAQIQTDAVRSPEIEANAVRSPEIEADAVRSSEIQADAVRSAEILNDSILLADIAPDARAALDEPRVRVSEVSNKPLPACDDDDNSFDDCPNITSLILPAGRWLVHAKFSLVGSFGISGSRCALVQSDTTTIDLASNLGFGAGLGSFDSEQVSLTDVLTTAPSVDSTVVAVRCAEKFFADLEASDVVLTAVEVKPVTAE
jgi:hypothetical protein